jgi:hypothetical protein
MLLKVYLMCKEFEKQADRRLSAGTFAMCRKQPGAEVGKPYTPS